MARGKFLMRRQDRNSFSTVNQLAIWKMFRSFVYHNPICRAETLIYFRSNRYIHLFILGFSLRIYRNLRPKVYIYTRELFSRFSRERQQQVSSEWSNLKAIARNLSLLHVNRSLARLHSVSV